MTLPAGPGRVAGRRFLLILGLAAHWASFRRDAFVGISGRPPSNPLRCAVRANALPGSRTLRHELGDIVEVRCEEDGLWYQAIVEHENSDGTFTVRFDKDGYEYHYPLIAWRVPKARHFIEELEEGEVLNGRVTDISSTGFYVDVGAEDEGFVHISEIKESRVSKISDEVRIGQDVSVRVLSTSNGKLTLSMKPVGSSQSSGVAAFRGLPPDMLLKATIVETPTFGAFATVQPPGGGEPCRGLIHISEMGRGFVPSAEEVVSVGQEVLVSVLSTEDNRLSLRLQEESEESFQIDKGVWLTGTVVKTMAYGAFVQVQWQGQDKVGLLHVSEMADDFIVDCEEAFSVGDNVTVKLLQSNKGRTSWTARKVRLSEEELEPFVGLSRKNSDVLTGLVQHVCDGGAYVLLQPPDGGIAVQGVLRRQEVDLKDGESVQDVLKLGEEVEVLVKSTESGRLMLTMTKLPRAFMDISENLWLKGVVQDVHDFGAFVKVQAPGGGEEYNGLVHISQVSEGFVPPEKLKEEVKVGQEVSVRVIEVDRMRLSLSMRPPANGQKEKRSEIPPPPAVPPAPKRPPFEGVKDEEWLEGKIKEVHPFGALAEVEDPSSNETVLGPIHLVELSVEYIDLVEEAVALNQSVKVRLLNREKPSFSLRPLSLPRLAEGVGNHTEVRGKVTRLSNLSADVVMEGEEFGSVKGYLLKSEMDEEAQDLVRCGQEVRSRILSVQADKLALTMRSPLDAESLANFKDCTTELEGVVQEVTPLGIFVRLQPPQGGPACRGLVHASFLDEKSQFAEGEMVKVKVHHVSNSSLLLSM